MKTGRSMFTRYVLFPCLDAKATIDCMSLTGIRRCGMFFVLRAPPPACSPVVFVALPCYRHPITMTTTVIPAPHISPNFALFTSYCYLLQASSPICHEIYRSNAGRTRRRTDALLSPPATPRLAKDYVLHSDFIQHLRRLLHNPLSYWCCPSQNTSLDCSASFVTFHALNSRTSVFPSLSSIGSSTVWIWRGLIGISSGRWEERQWTGTVDRDDNN